MWSSLGFGDFYNSLAVMNFIFFIFSPLFLLIFSKKKKKKDGDFRYLRKEKINEWRFNENT